MKNNISTKKTVVGKMLVLYTTVLIFILLCSHIAIQNVASVDVENNFSPAKEKDVKATGQVNEMLFSIKSFILFE